MVARSCLQRENPPPTQLAGSRDSTNSTYLSTNHNSPGDHTKVRVLLDAVIEGDDVEGVEHLPLVLVNTLHLAVKHGVHVDLEAT